MVRRSVCFLALVVLGPFVLPLAGQAAELNLSGDWKPSEDGTVLAFHREGDGTWSLVVRSLPPQASVDAKKKIGSAVATGLRWNPKAGLWAGKAPVGTIELRPREGFQEIVMTVNVVLFSKSVILSRVGGGTMDGRPSELPSFPPTSTFPR